MDTTTINRRAFLASAAGTAIAAGAGAGVARAVKAAEAQETPASRDATYDVIVVGYGVAGGTAARHAADAGASVLLIDGAPDGAEGGNSKFAKQLLASGHDVENAVTYLKELNAGFEVDEDVLRVFAEGMVEIPAYCAEYLGADVHSWIGRTDDPVLAPFVPEYPELPGTETFDAYTISEVGGDGAIWLKTKELVEEHADSIEVWTASPALHLVQDPATKAVVGVIIEHEGSELNVAATSGVVLACGGFEFNPQMIQDYLGASRLSGIGTPYNRGDGIRMALEVGADLWHMKSYEPGGASLMFDPGDGSSPLGAGSIGATGSTIYVGSDGSRYYNELAESRHGRVPHAGEFKPVDHPCHPWNRRGTRLVWTSLPKAAWSTPCPCWPRHAMLRRPPSTSWPRPAPWIRRCSRRLSSILTSLPSKAATTSLVATPRPCAPSMVAPTTPCPVPRSSSTPRVVPGATPRPRSWVPTASPFPTSTRLESWVALTRSSTREETTFLSA